MGECGRLRPQASEPLNTEVYNGVVVVILVAFVVVVSVAVFNVNVTYDTRGLQEDNAELVMHVVVGFVVSNSDDGYDEPRKVWTGSIPRF